MTTDEFVFELDTTTAWLPVPLSGVDPQRWAEETVDQLEHAVGRTLAAAERQVHLRLYAQVAARAGARAGAQDETLVGTSLLLPPGETVPVVAADLLLEPVDPALGVDALVEALVLAPQDRFGDPVVDELDTRAGPAVRVRQLGIVGPAAPAERSTAPVDPQHGAEDRADDRADDRAEDRAEDGAEDRVVTLVTVVWAGPLPGLATLLTATFGSPVEGELHAADVDDLARGLLVTRERSR